MPLLPNGTQHRDTAFQQLKPVCVVLSQTALTLGGTKPDVRRIAEDLEALHKTLGAVKSGLDRKLADYAFFPLSQVLKNSQKLPLRALESTLQCLSVLIEHGWRDEIQPQLAGQLLILCTLLADEKPQGLGISQSSNELQLAATDCLRHLFGSIEESGETHHVFSGDASVPQLGQTLTVVLDAIDRGSSVELQISASGALARLLRCVNDRELLASFLPGIVSKLTTVLTPQTKQRRNHQVLVDCLIILTELLGSLLSDNATISVRDPKELTTKSNAKTSKPSVIDAAWLETAAKKLKPSLANAMRLRDHAKEEVKQQLGELCLVLLRYCSVTLSSVSTMAAEVIVTLISDLPDSPLRNRMAVEAPSFSGILQETLHEWLQSLSHVMQSANEVAKVQRLRQMSTAHTLLVECGVDTTVIDRSMAVGLRDSVVITLQLPKKSRPAITLASPVQSLDLMAFEHRDARTVYESALVSYRGQEDVLTQVEDAVAQLSRSTSTSAFATDLARTLHNSTGQVQIANFWLLYIAIKRDLQDKENPDDWIDASVTQGDYKAHLEDLYAFALSILTDVSDSAIDTRMQALALRTVALRAETAGRDFRYELIDSLYPVLHTLATPDERLQKDSIITLNVITTACGYSDSRALIVENADYLTNAVALKLNAFDVSPQAPQVLLMMVRLAGPSLLPYLEDTVGSIFAALENYHGYSLLVELLFRVLSVMAEAGVKAPQLAIKDRPKKQNVGIEKEIWQPMDLATLAERLHDRAAEDKQNKDDDSKLEPGSHPKKPWGKPKDQTKTSDPQTQQEDEEAMMAKHDSQLSDDSDATPPAPKVYALLHQITELTQHFLPSASPSLRASLLSLIKTTTPAIAKHENTFLPLINTLWPEIVSRLDDEEPHVVATALDIVAELCEHAGDFMRGRVLQLWPALVELHSQIASEIVRTSKQSDPSKAKALAIAGPGLTRAVARMQASPADYTNTSSRRLWSSLVSMLTTIVYRVPLSPEAFDDAIEMLGPVLEDPEVRAVLEAENADAVWLARLKAGAVEMPEAPVVPEGMSWEFARFGG